MTPTTQTILDSGERAIAFRFQGEFAYVRLNEVIVRCKRHQYRHVLNAAIASPF